MVESIIQGNFDQIIDSLSLKDGQQPKEYDNIEWDVVYDIWWGVKENSQHAAETLCKCKAQNGDNLLIWLLASKADSDLLESVVEAYPDAAREKCSDGMYALHNSTLWGAPKVIVQKILEAYPVAISIKGGTNDFTPLHFGMAGGASLEVIEFLIDECPHSLKEKDDSGMNPLHFGVVTGKPLDVVQVLVEEYPHAVKDIDIDGWTPLHFAMAFDGSLEVIQFLLHENPNAAVEKNNNGRTPLHIGVSNGASIDVIKYLVEQSPSSIQIQTDDGQTPLHLGIESGASSEVIYFLLEECPNAAEEKDTNGMTPLHAGLANCTSPTIIAGLIQQCPRATLDQDNKGWTPLHHGLACGAPFDGICFLLYEYPGSAKLKDNNGMTPLHLGLANRISLDTIKCLVHQYPHGTEDQDNDGKTPLHFGLANGASISVVRFLLDKYPNAAKAIDKNGMTPLYVGITNGAPLDIIKCLIDHYPDTIEDFDNNISISLKLGMSFGASTDIMDFLLSVRRNKNDLVYKLEYLRENLDGIPKIIKQLNNLGCPYMFNFIFPDEFSRFKKDAKTRQKKKGRVVETTEDFSQRLERARHLCECCIDFLKKDNEPALIQTADSGWNLAFGGQNEVIYMQLLCGATFKPALTYKINLQRHQEEVIKFTRIGVNMCSIALIIAMLWNSTRREPKLFGYKLCHIPQDEIEKAISFLDEIKQSSLVDALNKQEIYGLNLRDLKYFEDFLETLDKKGKIRHCLNDFQKSVLKNKTWEDALVQGGCELDNNSNQTLFVVKSKACRLQTDVHDEAREDEEEISSIVRQLLPQIGLEGGERQSEVNSTRPTQQEVQWKATAGEQHHRKYMPNEKESTSVMQTVESQVVQAEQAVSHSTAIANRKKFASVEKTKDNHKSQFRETDASKQRGHDAQPATKGKCRENVQRNIKENEYTRRNGYAMKEGEQMVLGEHQQHKQPVRHADLSEGVKNTRRGRLFRSLIRKKKISASTEVH